MWTVLIVLATAVVMIAYEARKPGRKWPEVRGWWFRAAALNFVQVGVVFLAGNIWDPWFRSVRPWSAEWMGPTWGGLVGYFAITFVYYWWHRFRHSSDFCWRWFHQVHHSPQRIEVITSFYKHPFEIVVNGVLSSLVLYVLVGVNAEGATLAVLLSGLAELFYHWNVTTPYWLGFIFQRPESHCVHHQQGLHKYNYSDLPLWDMLFGTFYNPREWNEQCGFGEEREQRFGEMLLGMDVHRKKPTREESSV